MPERDGGSVYDALPDGVVVADAGGNVVDLNAAALRILGDGEWLGRPLADVLPLIDPQGRDWWACTRPYDGLSTRVRQPERWLTLTRPGEADQSVLVTAAYVRGHDRKVDSVVVSLRDTNARSRTERSGNDKRNGLLHFSSPDSRQRRQFTCGAQPTIQMYRKRREPAVPICCKLQSHFGVSRRAGAAVRGGAMHQRQRTGCFTP